MTRIALIGSRTTKERNGRGNGLTSWEITDGEWVPIDRLNLTNPSWLTKGQSSLAYVLHGDGNTVSVVNVSPSGQLTHLQETTAHGENPVHCAVVEDSYLVVANYATGTVVSLPISDTGLLGEPITVVHLAEENARLQQEHLDATQKPSHPHQIIVDADAGVIYVPDKGLDAVFTLAFSSGKIEMQSAVSTRDGSGPRHGVIINDKLYVVGELNSTLMSFTRGPSGNLTMDADICLLPERMGGTENTGSGICYVPDNSVLLVSNRGSDGISVLQVGESLKLSHFVPCYGPFPRFISSSETNSLLVAHEYGDTITIHSLDAILEGDSRCRVVASTGSPVCVLTTD
ncbi:lactonase family protein [Corynebacterium sp.]|uniref:lactonase family protein n=1 Tax=Corynebacterium sp. TaxID=1720 RepID=UPI003B3B1717